MEQGRVHKKVSPSLNPSSKMVLTVLKGYHRTLITGLLVFLSSLHEPNRGARFSSNHHALQRSSVPSLLVHALDTTHPRGQKIIDANRVITV